MKYALTMVELLITLAILSLLISVLIILVNPAEQLQKGRDSKKLSDLSKFEIQINDYKVDYRVYSDLTPPPNINYYHTEVTYELNTDLEYYTDKEQNDGGNSPELYESGNDLTLN